MSASAQVQNLHDFDLYTYKHIILYPIIPLMFQSLV